MINFLNLRYFMLIAQEQNITRVAENEHISQQSLSNQLKKIEERFGTKLFDRTRGISLTYAGEVLYKTSEGDILNLKSQLSKYLFLIAVNAPEMAALCHGEITCGPEDYEILRSFFEE